MAYGSARYGGARYAGTGDSGSDAPPDPDGGGEESGSLAVASEPSVAGAFFPGAPR